MDRFHPPGFLEDFARRPDSAEDRAEGWSAIVSSWMDNAAQVYGTPEVPSLFFNPLKDETPGEPASESIAWDAFPRFLTRWFRDDDEPDEKRWRAAETLRPLRINGRALRRVDEQGFLREELQLFYRQQDEYCEWHVDRDGEGRITRICFSSEAPEYWEFLAEGTRPFFAAGDPRRDLVAGDLGLVEELYREHVSPEVSAADLVWPFDVAFFDDDTNPQTGEPFGWRFYARKGTYNPFNLRGSLTSARSTRAICPPIRAEPSTRPSPSRSCAAGSPGETPSPRKRAWPIRRTGSGGCSSSATRPRSAGSSRS